MKTVLLVFALTLGMVTLPSAAYACKTIVFEHKDFGGKFHRLTERHSDFRRFNFNDRLSSLVVLSGRWCFYQHIDFRGTRYCLNPGIYSWVQATNIPNDHISSARCRRHRS